MICLPPALHAEAAIAAFEVGAHVYVEKPLALTVEDAAAAEAAWRASGRIGAVGFNFRFNANFGALKRRIASGELGEITGFRCAFASPRRALPGWKSQRATGGGALRDLAVHHLDLLSFLTGERVETVSAVERSINVEGDALIGAATMASGVPAQLIATQTTAHAANSVEVYCEAGLLIAEASDPGPRRVARPYGRMARAKKAMALAREFAPRRLLRAGGEPSFRRALDAFLDAGAGGAAWPGADIADGRRVAELVSDAGAKSAL